MAYEVTATKKRPQTFDELAGQEFVATTLKSSIREGKNAQAYIFSGPRGVGKTSAARILARTLNCLEPAEGNPCGTCSSCVEIVKGSSLDVIEIDGASNTGVNDIREIKDEVLFAPNNSKYKVYIIDEVHMLSNSAFNALLKTVEEPPPYILFIFATTEINKVPATIRSRCQQFNFRLIPQDVIKGLLANVCQELGIEAEEDALFWIAKEATGSLRDSYTLFDQVVSFSEGHITLQKIKDKIGIVGLDELNEIVETVVKGDAEKVLSLLDDIMINGIAIEQFIVDLSEFFRNILFIKNNILKESILGFKAERFSQYVIETLSTDQIEYAMAVLLQLFRDIRYSVNQRFEMELVLSRLSKIRSYIPRNQIFSELKTLQQDISKGATIVEKETPDNTVTSEKKNDISINDSLKKKSSESLTDSKPEQKQQSSNQVQQSHANVQKDVQKDVQEKTPEFTSPGDDQISNSMANPPVSISASAQAEQNNQSPQQTQPEQEEAGFNEAVPFGDDEPVRVEKMITVEEPVTPQPNVQQPAVQTSAVQNTVLQPANKPYEPQPVENVQEIQHEQVRKEQPIEQTQNAVPVQQQVSEPVSTYESDSPPEDFYDDSDAPVMPDEYYDSEPAHTPPVQPEITRDNTVISEHKQVQDDVRLKEPYTESVAPVQKKVELKPAEPKASAAESSGTIDIDPETFLKRLAGSLKQSKITLSRNLSRALNCSFEGDHILLTFDKPFVASQVRQNMDAIQEKMKEIFSFVRRIEVKVIKTDEVVQKEEAVVGENIEMLKRVFKGQIIS